MVCCLVCLSIIDWIGVVMVVVDVVIKSLVCIVVFWVVFEKGLGDKIFG